MTRMIRGSVLLAACVGVWACTNDPTSEEAGKAYAILASPSVLYVTQDDSQFVDLELVDELGGQLAETWNVSGSGATFTVAIDSGYRPVFSPDGSLTLPEKQTQVRVYVKGVASASDTMTVSAGGLSLDIPVFVLPANVPATFNTTTPNIGENLVLTMPAGLKLLPDASFSAGDAGAPIVVSRAADSTSVTLLVAPGTDGPITINGVTPSFASLNLTLNSTDVITATSTSTFVGTDALATAPEVTMPAVGGSYEWYDIPLAGTMYYKFTVADSTTLRFTIDWADAGGDIDIAWYTAAGAFLGYFGSGTGAHPEVSTHTYAAGSYVMSPEIYSGGPGAWYKFKLEAVSAP